MSLMRLARPRTMTVRLRGAERRREGGEALFDEPAGELVEFGALLGALAAERGAGLGDGAADREGREVVAGLGQGARGQARGQGDDAVLDLAVLADEDRQGRLGVEADELDVLQHHVGLGGDHEAGAAGQAREHLARAGEEVLDAALVRLRPRCCGRSARARASSTAPTSSMASTKKRRPSWVGGAAGGGVRRGDEAEILEVGHDVAHRGRREAGFEQAAQVARADRHAGLEVALDELCEDLLAAGIEHREEIFRGFQPRAPR